MRPTEGMYADCRDQAECNLLGALCLTVSQGGTTVAGFCTMAGCDQGVPCDPAPGPGATVDCVPIDINGTTQHICALSCGGDGDCPGGMQCYSVEGGLCS